MYGIISTVQGVSLDSSSSTRNSSTIFSGRLVEVLSLSWLVTSCEAETGAAGFPIPASQTKGHTSLGPASCSKGQICLSCRTTCIWERRGRKLSRNQSIISAGEKRKSCNSSWCLITVWILLWKRVAQDLVLRKFRKRPSTNYIKQEP